MTGAAGPAAALGVADPGVADAFAVAGEADVAGDAEAAVLLCPVAEAAAGTNGLAEAAAPLGEEAGALPTAGAEPAAAGHCGCDACAGCAGLLLSMLDRNAFMSACWSVAAGWSTESTVHFRGQTEANPPALASK